jgi:alpha-galactosidase
MVPPETIDLSTPALRCAFHTAGPLALATFGLPNLPWALESSGLFAVEVAGRRIDARTPDLVVTDTALREDAPGRRELTVVLRHAPTNLAIDYHVAFYAGTALIETWVTLCNDGAAALPITRIDSLVLDLPAGAYEIQSFTSDWGLEFEPHAQPLTAPVTLESRAGRSSKGHLPWFALVRDGESLLSGAVAWSGNWVARLEPNAAGVMLSGGLHDWAFAVELAPGAVITLPPFVVALAAGRDLDAVATQYARVGRRFWYPHSPLADRLPVEWNHWWSYEDKDLDEAVFRRNVDVAAGLGIEVCTLDAGWFGPSDAATDWYEQRGDWDLVNTERFPSGLRALSDYVHERGMAFGLWCEIEAIGKRARLAADKPELVATREGEPLGYVCLGSRAGWEWALATLERIITEYRCDWIKLDFNLDPGAGCDRSDHGHGAGDGLYAHYNGYYALLAEVRRRHPHVVLENCSSGGLRIDLGIARQTHMAFLSDPDWPEHSLQCFWGASLMLAPDALLHWGYCEWRHAEHRMQNFNPRAPALTLHQIDYYTRISMLRRFGFSQRLPDLPEWVAARYRELIADYQTHVRRFVRAADMRRLAGQPQRFGAGERWAAFQYTLPDADEHLLAAFRLPGGAPERTCTFARLDPQRTYTLTWLGEARSEQCSGAELMSHGITLALPEEGSAMIVLRLLYSGEQNA